MNNNLIGIKSKYQNRRGGFPANARNDMAGNHVLVCFKIIIYNQKLI